ncbi:HAD domain-containing protein [Spongiactinospora rosea]|nr:HAD domain-containing protein [Spongiactinospora rosea]
MTPLIMLAVDGVIAPFGRPGSQWQEHRVVADGLTLTLWLNPATGPKLLKLAEITGAELVWATAWDHDANVEIGPLIGLPTQSVCVVGQDAPPDLAAKIWCFKTPRIAQYTAGRPFVWFDDSLTLRDAAYLRGVEGVGDHLLIHVEPYRGLTDDHMERARAWLAKNRRPRGGS